MIQYVRLCFLGHTDDNSFHYQDPMSIQQTVPGTTYNHEVVVVVDRMKLADDQKLHVVIQAA
jgi:hypothetical protein